MERFQREISTQARLHHPNILPLFDSGAAAGRLYYAMPYVPAGTLRDRLRDLQEAARSADPAAVERAAGEARDAARSTAEACGLPADQFLGG